MRRPPDRMRMPYFLVYISTAEHLMSTAELRTLLETARQVNAGLGVTGALLYRDGTFMQVLEGEQATVLELYATIVRDPRHYDVTLVVDGRTPSRQFADWSMAFRDLTAGVDELASGFSAFMLTRDPSYGPSPTIAQRLLLSFRNSISAPA